MSIKIATWNVNSIRVRLPHIIDWLEAQQPDLLALQETKVIDEQFPREAIEALGYHVNFSGQKTYNGVAILSRITAKDIETAFPGYDDPQKRIMAATYDEIRLINLYIPNGSTPDSDKYQYKLTWLAHMQDFIAAQSQQYPKLVVVGDFNIAPEDDDVHDPEAWQDSVLVSPPERAAFQQLLDIGLTDSFRLFEQVDKSYSWWDYRAAAFRRNRGLRIDHILISRPLVESCQSCIIDKSPRKLEKPSDHAPVLVEI